MCAADGLELAAHAWCRTHTRTAYLSARLFALRIATAAAQRPGATLCSLIGHAIVLLGRSLCHRTAVAPHTLAHFGLVAD